MNTVLYKERLHSQLLAHSFQAVQDRMGNTVEGLYLRVENPVLYVLGLCEGENIDLRESLLQDYAGQLRRNLDNFGCTHLICLCALLLTEEKEMPEGGARIDERVHFVRWNVSVDTGRVQVGKGDPNRLLGIEKLMAAAARGEDAVKPLQAALPAGKPWVCICLFAICGLLLAYTMLSPDGDGIISQFGLSRRGVLNGEYYRFLTSMFLHGGIIHLISNGIYLYYFGVKAEQLLGRGKFLLLYLFSGLCAGLLSVLCHDVLAIGASGAIYGLLGAMLLLTKKRGAAYTQMNYATMLLLAFVSISFGFLNMGVDNFAHIGGFLGGGILFFFLLREMERKNQ